MRKNRRIELKKETLRSLEKADLRDEVAGGAIISSRTCTSDPCCTDFCSTPRCL
ncbi:MAG: hypothetical protein M3O15_08910 [Acidobacteriota bacterium]|nr:hypothetical protein [Acidobacteriota bacterium]